jgi:hypothetical protein
MKLYIVIFFLAAGAIAAPFVTPEKRWLRLLLFLVPPLALISILLPFPFPSSFSIPWTPDTLFSESSLVFRADASSVPVSIYLCCLLLLIEWSRPLRRSPVASARIILFGLTAIGLLACFASSALAVALAWAWVDFLCFLSIIMLESPAEIGLQGISSTITRSLGILAINISGNLLVLFPASQGNLVNPADWSLGWNPNSSNLGFLFFLVGITLRLLVFPMQFSLLRIRTSSTGVEVFLRVIPIAIVLALLSKAWPAQSSVIISSGLHVWALLFLSLFILLASVEWWVSSSPFSKRDLFFSIIPGWALLSALVVPRANQVFLAAGALLILGGGILLLYFGFLPHRRWMSAFPLMLAFFLAGFPLSPASILISNIYPKLISFSLPAFTSLVVSQTLVLGAIFLMVFEPSEEFPSNESFHLMLFCMGALVPLAFLFYPGWSRTLSPGTLLLPVGILAAGIGLRFLAIRAQPTREGLFQILEKTFRLEWIQRIFSFLFTTTSVGVYRLEALLSSEGALFWSLGIALLLYFIFRGG